MQTVNTKLYTIKYKLKKLLEASIAKDNEAIKNGATITFKDYANIKTVDCTRKSWSKEAQAIADEYLTKLGYEKQATTYVRIDVDNIDSEADTIVDNILAILENDNNNNIIKRVASKVADNK